MRPGQANRGPGPIRDEVLSLPTYAFVTIAETRARLAAEGRTIIDFSVGEPREETPAFLREALADAIPVRTSYPPTHGTPELRGAAARWLERRFGVIVDPERCVLATLGSKEALYSLASAVVQPGIRDVVLVPDPSYPIYATGARMAGAQIVFLPLLETNGFLPDLGALSEDLLRRTALLWTNYPNNPTNAQASLAFYERAAELAREHGFWLASDEAYVDIYGDVPPRSALEAGLDNVITFHTLSKRSAMAGFRTGFVAGDPRLLAALRRLRPSQGVATPGFVQVAATQAWNDDAHAAGMRSLYCAKWSLLRDALVATGSHLASSDAGFFHFFRPPHGDAGSCVERMLAKGILLVQGDQFGPGGAGWVRLALVPTLEECEAAASVLRTEL